jgi:PDZ domain-containing protein
VAWRKTPPFWKGVAGLSVALVLGAALAFIRTPYYVTAPGMALDTAKAIRVEGGQVHEDHGYLLTVFAQPANVWLWLWGQFDHRVQLETAKEFLGDLPDFAAYDQMAKEMMVDAQRTAKAIGLQRAGYGRGVDPIGLVVTAVLKGAPAEGKLLPKDRIVAAAGLAVRTHAELQRAFGTIKPGDPVALQVERNGVLQTITVQTGKHPQEATRPYLGVSLEQAVRYDDEAVPIEILLPWITGPSCGLAMTLQVVDQLTPGGIYPNERIAITGTIEIDGSVGAIGGIAQKVVTAEAAGAQVIMVPPANFEDAKRAAARIKVVPVSTIDAALAWLKQERSLSTVSG